MKKKDLIPIIIIVALFFIYPVLDRTIVAKWFPAKQRPAAAAPAEAGEAQAEGEAAAATDGAADIPMGTELASGEPAEAEAGSEGVEPAAAPAEEPPAESRPEETVELANAVAKFVLTSKGAGIRSAAMIDKDEADETRYRYPMSEKAIDDPVTFDFSERASGALTGLPEGGAAADYTVAASDERSVTFERTMRNGLTHRRTISLGDGYQLAIEDEIRNQGREGVALKGLGVQLGWMPNLEGESDTRIPLLGVDTLSGGDVKFWSSKFERWFPAKEEGAVQSVAAPLNEGRVDWVAVKNKYFAQLLHPAEEGAGVSAKVLARRGAPVPTRTLLVFPSTAYPFAGVSGEMAFDDAILGAGEAWTAKMDLYVGPKVYEKLAANGYHEEDILQLGFWRFIGIWILKLMVWFRDTIWPHNYGLSIILLTLVIRILFWPLNQKSMKSTQRMQEIQPQLTAIREKYKSDPQKQQQEMMRVYSENKINPMGGCLPMLIQIPVFFALFVVLRGAIELRFSSFLWINDLSTPENLFRDQIGFGINILPILMGVTMWWQQRLTPTSDPQQQKMMVMMPVLFTVLFYSFPAGLSLYWTTNQVLMIVQMSRMRRKKAAEGTAAATPAKPADAGAGKRKRK